MSRYKKEKGEHHIRRCITLNPIVDEMLQNECKLRGLSLSRLLSEIVCKKYSLEPDFIEFNRPVKKACK